MIRKPYNYFLITMKISIADQQKIKINWDVTLILPRKSITRKVSAFTLSTQFKEKKKKPAKVEFVLVAP